jgi:Uma2 family endonuclease
VTRPDLKVGAIQYGSFQNKQVRLALSPYFVALPSRNSALIWAWTYAMLYAKRRRMEKFSMHPTIHAFTIEEYQQFLESQSADDLQRYELIRGVIYEMPPIGVEHASTVDILTRLLHIQLGNTYLVRVQNPIQLEESQPQPDLTVIEWAKWDRTTLPTAESISLVIEVAATTLTYDREVKALLYAEAGIPEYWLVNLPDKVIQHYQTPTQEGYRVQRTWKRGEVLTTHLLPSLSIPVTEVIG